jgi:hypothetical protein
VRAGCRANDQVALLRKFLADLPEPVLTYALYQEFIEIARVRDAQRRTNDVKLVISSLPAANQMLLFVLAGPSRDSCRSRIACCVAWRPSRMLVCSLAWQRTRPGTRAAM